MIRNLIDDQARLRSLSPRERQILDLTLIGLPTKEIARRLVISPKTVASHRECMSAKLGVTSVVELVRFGIRAGLTSGE